MLKILIILCFVLPSISAFGSEVHLITMKERLRISLWVDGIEQKSEATVNKDSKNKLPVELESALRKL